MGGFFRAVTRIFSKPKAVVIQQQAPVQAAATPTSSKVDKRSTLAASGHGGSTIMTGSEGLEEEANVQTTALGMGKKKKIKA
jgi:hypothetical protein